MYSERMIFQCKILTLKVLRPPQQRAKDYTGFISLALRNPFENPQLKSCRFHAAIIRPFLPPSHPQKAQHPRFSVKKEGNCCICLSQLNTYVDHAIVYKGNYDWQTNRPTDRRTDIQGHREVSLQIRTLGRGSVKQKDKERERSHLKLCKPC